MWRWWPCFVGGFCGPLLARLLGRWMSQPLAVGVAFFIMWIIVGVVFAVRPPDSRWSFVRWAVGGAGGALIAGVATSLIPWK